MSAPPKRGHLILVATLARAMYLELERVTPEERTCTYMRWLDRRGQLISTFLAETRH
jgi:hypothetical protein